MTGEETLKFEQFKLDLLAFIESRTGVCSEFKKDVLSCSNEWHLEKVFSKYRDEVYERLGGEPDLQDEVDELEWGNRDLRRDIDELEERIEELTLGYSLDDEFKLKALHEYHNQYTPWELEELLKNGKELLKR